MRKYIFLLFIPFFSANANFFAKHHTLIVKQRKAVEHYARFSYYSNYTTLIDEVKKELTDKGYKVSAAQVPVFSTSSIDEIRALAARYGADRILVLKERYSRDSHINILAVTYLTIIGMYLFPGNSMRSECEIQAQVIDTPSGTVLQEANSIAGSHKYIYRIGNADSVLYASYLESMTKARELLIDDLLKPKKKEEEKEENRTQELPKTLKKEKGKKK